MTSEPPVETWFPVTAAHPPRNVRVVVQWAGRRFRASRVVDPGSRAVRWVTAGADGEVVWLPPRGEAGCWGAEPDAWQPERPDLWRAPLPEALLSCAPRLWSATQRFAAVDDAEAADLAREMEQSRMAAGSVSFGASDCPPGSRPEAPRARWWENPSAITYSPPGAISRREAEGRVMRAIACFVWGGAGNGVQRALLRDYDEATVRDIAEREAASASGIVPLRPLPADIADELTATGWLPVLARPHRAALRLMAAPWPVTLADLAVALGPSDRTGRRCTRAGAQAVLDAALDEVCAVANGHQTAGVRVRAARLAAVRAGNKAFRGVGRHQGSEPA
jgi:hypothetical protein